MEEDKPVTHFRQKIGSWGEDLAADYLRQQGYQIIARNYRTTRGEIDLIARTAASGSLEGDSRLDAHVLTLFVEVKTRTSLKFGYPEQAVTPAKRAHLLAAVQEYIQMNPEVSGDWRVDVIAVFQPRGASPPQIQVFENAITADE